MGSEEELFSKAVPVKLKSQDREERLAVYFNGVLDSRVCLNFAPLPPGR